MDEYLIYVIIFISIFLIVINIIPQTSGKKVKKQAPSAFRIFHSLIVILNFYNRRIKSPQYRESLANRFIWGGVEGVVSFEDFLSLKEISVILSPFVLWLLVKMYLGMSFSPTMWAIFIMVIMLVMFMLPDYWLNQRIQIRQKKLIREFPNFLDLLVLSVEAGMEFTLAVRRIVKRMKEGPLTDELGKFLNKLELGSTRKEALQSFMKRVNIEEAISFGTSVIQADEIGASIGPVLRIQSDEIRMKRFNRAEKEAAQAPVKMIFPLMTFIFPATFIILLGPVILQIVNSGFLK